AGPGPADRHRTYGLPVVGRVVVRLREPGELDTRRAELSAGAVEVVGLVRLRTRALGEILGVVRIDGGVPVPDRARAGPRPREGVPPRRLPPPPPTPPKTGERTRLLLHPFPPPPSSNPPKKTPGGGANDARHSRIIPIAQIRHKGPEHRPSPVFAVFIPRSPL